MPGAYYSPSARYRIIQFYPHLKKLGFDVTIRYPYPDRVFNTSNTRNKFWHKIHPRISQMIRFISTILIIRDVHKFDIVISNRDIVPDTGITFLENLIMRRNTKLIIDFDDSIYLGNRSKKMNKLFSSASYLVAGNKILSQYALKFNKRVKIIPTVVDTNIFVPSIKPDYPNESIIIGWIGSKGPSLSHLPIVFPALIQLEAKYKGKIKYIFISDHMPNIPKEINTISTFIPWKAEEEVRMIQKMDIGLMPLPDCEFERGKCGFKAIQYMSVGIPAIVSPVGANSYIVEHGEDGFHCHSTEDWIKNISILIEDRSLRLQMGIKARKKVEINFSLMYALTLWEKVIDDVTIGPNI